MIQSDELAQERDSTAPTSEGASPALAKSTTPPRKQVVPVATDEKMAHATSLATNSLPVSMLAHPPNEAASSSPSHFGGELPEDFEAALERVETRPRRSGLMGLWHRLRGRANAKGTKRVVAFDGFRSGLYDEKIERDRRYGTVYTVREERNAYLVRLEMPRRLPASALKEAWGVGDEMPDYDYSIQLQDQVLSIRGSVVQEAIRRLAYVSSSFPADFLTRIEFSQTVAGFVHRLRDKFLEVIVFKRGAIPT
jgi:hypothetical protein